MRNISQKAIKQILIPVLPLEEQSLIVDSLIALESAASKSGFSLAHLRALRSNLLSALLSGEHEIPEFYDALLEETAS
ncbi:restriction endonuclease subunit S [Brevibacterium zhoupengii]|uniref:restriction endonuclease subunit S n=1 Tax=Brevibacterium zhoupengii TaxID=2898795 RepID=UPI001F09140F|nr:hypothetical protein [Brevibacterium zhoupengii]